MIGEDSFMAALHQLIVHRDAAGQLSIGPIDDPDLDAVSAWIVCLIATNPALLHHVSAQVQAGPVDADGCRTLPVRHLIGALLTTCEQGNPALCLTA